MCEAKIFGLSIMRIKAGGGAKKEPDFECLSEGILLCFLSFLFDVNGDLNCNFQWFSLGEEHTYIFIHV